VNYIIDAFRKDLISFNDISLTMTNWCYTYINKYRRIVSFFPISLKKLQDFYKDYSISYVGTLSGV